MRSIYSVHMQRHEWKKINIENDFLRRPGVRPAMTSKSIYAWLHVSVARVASECVRHVKSIKCCSDKGRFCHFPLFVFASLLFYFIIHIESYMCFVLVQIFVSFCFKLQSHSFFFAFFSSVFICTYLLFCFASFLFSDKHESSCFEFGPVV